jgi:hypothetical protein
MRPFFATTLLKTIVHPPILLHFDAEGRRHTTYYSRQTPSVRQQTTNARRHTTYDIQHATKGFELGV